MAVPAKEMLKRLGAGESVQAVCAAAGLTRAEFDAWWRQETASRVPDMTGTRTALLGDAVEIIRDQWGIPHIFAGQDEDLFVGYGYAMAQDRLWQLDYLRRKAMGRLSEVLGPDGLEADVVARTVGINRIAAAQVERLPDRTVRRLEGFSRGINAVVEECRDRLPIEFDMLDYEPEPWSPLDSVAVWAEFRWYLTGRLPVIALPEVARRVLGDGPLYQAFLTGEAADQSIVPPGSYPSRTTGGGRVGETVGDPAEGLGSNNWVVSGERSASELPMVASDPHIAFGSVSCWYEVHLSSGPLNVVGTGYAGVPMVIFGRNERVAWGLTNNICSQRDLYQEKTDDEHPGSFLYDGRWEPAREVTEEIAVKGQGAVSKTVRFSRNGPLVDELLPPAANGTGPVSLRWAGRDVLRRTLLSAVRERGPQLRRAQGGIQGVEGAHVERWVRRRRWAYRVPERWAHTGPQTVGPRLQAGMGPGAPVGRADTVRWHAGVVRPAAGMGPIGKQPHGT